MREEPAQKPARLSPLSTVATPGVLAQKTFRGPAHTHRKFPDLCDVCVRVCVYHGMYVRVADVRAGDTGRRASEGGETARSRGTHTAVSGVCGARGHLDLAQRPAGLCIHDTYGKPTLSELSQIAQTNSPRDGQLTILEEK